MDKISDSRLGDWESLITGAGEDPQKLTRDDVQKAITGVLRSLESGHLRVASPPGAGPACGEVPITLDPRTWEVHSWVKQAILLALRWRTLRVLGTPAQPYQGSYDFEARQGRVHGAALQFCDKIDTRTDLLE